MLNVAESSIRPFFITEKQFGLLLYQSIKMCSGIASSAEYTSSSSRGNPTYVFKGCQMGAILHGTLNPSSHCCRVFS